ncbi:hypothetical protein NZ698_01255 [Chryseobacterium sp. PBS4-4]|uniref:Tetratricopeptide repeat protein n=1 Tax=Chryseobacterium edaphi TaxID=2976532 RepID=A0ABT2W0P6_9FLAO|nr:hypothetical protein [Chryseobacterium edaphi]MCU7615811.1 hypothetical protein [Chryseobacterium edaphi]
MAFDCYKKSSEIKYEKGQSKALSNIVFSYFILTDYKKVIEYADKLQQLTDNAKDKNFYFLLNALRYKAPTYAYLGFYDKAYKTIDEAEKLCHHLTGDEYFDMMGTIYWSRSEIEYSKGSDAKKNIILSFDKKGAESYQKIKNNWKKNHLLGMQFHNIGMGYLNLKQLDSALYYNIKALSASKIAKDSINDTYITYGIAETYRDMKNHDSAIFYYKKTEAYLIKFGKKDDLLDIYESMASLYKNQGDEKKYIYYLEKVNTLSDSLQHGRINNIQEVSKKIINEEKEKQNKWFYFIFLSLLIIISIIVYFTFRFFKNYRKEKQQKEETKLHLTKKEEKISELELKVNNAFEEVLELAKNDDPAFLARFKEVYSEFYDKLTSTYPDLTISQLRFCAMMKLNFSTKEIAHYHHTTVRGVQTKKTRLRKQLHLPSEEDLNKWMMEF